MTHTLPDYTTKYKLAKIFGNVDNAELAARLGACSALDRRGNLIWYDDFDAAAAVKWKLGGDAGYTAALSSDRAWMGNQSMKTVTDVDVGDTATIRKDFALPIERTIGLEFMFYIATGAPTVLIYIVGYTGTAYFQAQLQYDHNLGKLYYYNSASAWIELPIVDNVDPTGEHWFYVKLVLDWDSKEYVRAIFGGTQYDLSGLGMKTAANVTARKVIVVIYNRAETAAAATVYYDNFIFTQNEP